MSHATTKMPRIEAVLIRWLLFLFLGCVCPLTRADTIVDFGVFEMEFVHIGHAGNADDPIPAPPEADLNLSLHPPMGSVDYEFSIGKYEVTCHQQTTFRNSYFPPEFNNSCDEWGETRPGLFISASESREWINELNLAHGFPPAYKLEFDPYWKPGEPGYTPENPMRNRQAKFALPSHDEFHKAAFYNPEEDRYHLYSTGDETPSNAWPDGSTALNSIVVGGHPYWEVVDVGLAGGESAYGVVGLMGNASEYEETNADPESISGYSPAIRRGAQGGSRPTDFQAGLSRSNARESNATIRVVMLEDPVSDLAGDFDFNGEVNFLDFLNLANHFGDEQERFAKYHRGDANGDLKTDFQDFLILANSFGATSSDVSAVPEPSSSLLALLVVFPLLLARRRRTT